ncbi:hypothetical protein AB0O76_42935 [Streptomyces sp. NPDC086554]|uniref:hypothetical protein n=1 Tax=Streptomyces sp. NPDC086554 TaxID=3154864 RepID=UPI00342DA235
MQNRKLLWLRAAAPVSILAIALTACAGPDEDSGSRSKGGASKAAGRQLSAGESVTAAFEEDEGEITYTAVAQKVTVGTKADAESMSDPKKVTGYVPVVAHVKYTSRGGVVFNTYPNVGDIVEIYADGTPGSNLAYALDDAPGCEKDMDIVNWKPGRSHVICQTCMVPKGAKELAVHWAPKDGKPPYVWTFKNPIRR